MTVTSNTALIGLQARDLITGQRLHHRPETSSKSLTKYVAFTLIMLSRVNLVRSAICCFESGGKNGS